ncbi:MarR family winged helix-turn-helix transcriptional regulator [Streptomyces profundus]|uniref:MarR family winged helix-turn-helix transcriptional regulator n=1 Tax=Streptomyces profundus TaxID=2867410 RepID=UPI001D16C741|nr:MarR family transcriptional regulator [Streptomyces sp. MA3_2.13]UED87738.1 MarR family transcriptional regulator [Streptomyces sp. MA3_2.13]
MTPESQWLSAPEGRAWRSYLRMHGQLRARLLQHLMRDSGLSEADYEVLVTLAGSPDGRMTSREVRCALIWEKSRLSHQVRRMEQRGLIIREVNPADARSSLLRLTEWGGEVIERAVPPHVERVREHFLSLLSPAELELLTRVGERVLTHLAREDEVDPPREI